MHILPVKQICLCYVHYKTIEIIFEINIVISILNYLPFPASPFGISYCVILIPKKRNFGCEWACEIKKWLIIILKGFIKQPAIKQGPTYLSFSSLIDCCVSVFFSFVIRAFADFKNIDKISSASFHCI